MGKYRKLPFGYCMEFGHIVAHPDEKPWVSYIFQQYALGASFKELTAYMATEGIPYETDKLWNKNMIARMLADPRYIGEKGFPVIIEEEMFKRVSERRNTKKVPIPKTEAQKALRKKCDCPVTPYIEQEVLFLLNILAKYPGQIAVPQKNTNASHRQDLLTKELDAFLMDASIDDKRTQAKILEISVVMYESIGSEEYETFRLRQVFQREQPRSELDAELINNNISAIQVDSRRKVKVILKNGQVIERGEQG